MNHNQQPQDMYYPQHMSTGQPPQPQTVTSGNMGHYSQQQQAQHLQPLQQPPLLQPGPPQYAPGPAPYQQYGGYTNGLQSPQSAGHQIPGPVGSQGSMLPLPAMSASQPYGTQGGFDATGQVAPPGMKPRVTATLWEDEGSLCFQVEAKGVCVARREGSYILIFTRDTIC